MPISSFMGLQTSLRGLLAHQRALDVTGHNVANASTVGYSRQELLLSAAPAQAIPAGHVKNAGAQIGTGVDVVDYRRARDLFLDLQFRAQNSVLGDAGARTTALDGVDLAVAEPSDNGLHKQLQRFWSSWSDVANDPSSIAARQALVDQAKTVGSVFSTLDNQLATVAANASAELASITAYDPAAGRYGDVAQIATELAQLGQSIRTAALSRQTPNDLLDKRDDLLDKLAGFGQVSVVAIPDGGVKVFFGGTAEPLVDDGEVNDPATPGDDRVTWPQALTAPGGKVGALMDLSRTPGGVIDAYRTSLAGVASELTTAVNDLTRQGPSGRDFFGYDPLRGASGLTVLRTAQEVEPGRSAAAGANDLALELASLRGGTVDQTYGAFVARVGSEVRLAARAQANAETLTRAIDDRRQGASGVSLDEEMTNLVRFQRGYQASARTMSAMDEMLETLINRTGRVGL